MIPLQNFEGKQCVMGNACKIGEMQLAGHVSGYLFLVTHVTQRPMLKHMHGASMPCTCLYCMQQTCAHPSHNPCIVCLH